MKVALYLRVSTQGQDTKNQLLALHQFAECRALEVAAVYQEAGVRLAGWPPTGTGRLLHDALLGRFEAVLEWALDRLSREGPLAILSLVHRLGRYGVKVLSHQEPWTEAPGELAEILYAVVGWVARMESQRLSERTRAGLARAIAHGHYSGRPPGSKDKRKRKKRVATTPAWADMELYPVGRA